MNLYNKINPDKSISVSSSSPNYKGENITNSLRFLIPPDLNGIDIANATIELNIINSLNAGNIYPLTADTVPYNETLLSYTFEITTLFTNNPDTYSYWLTITSSENEVLKTATSTFVVQDKPQSTSVIPESEQDLIDSIIYRIEVLEAGGGGTGGSAVTTKDVTSLLDVGAIITGQTIASGTTFQTFVEKLLTKTFYPTFVAPSATFTSSLLSSVECGTIANNTLTLSLNRGQILGKNVNGIWSSSEVQNYRSGSATNYTINSSDLDLVNTLTMNNYQVVEGVNTFTGSIDYGIGYQPKDSVDADYSVPLPTGKIDKTVTVYGRRNLFYGCDSINNVAYTTSAEIRALSNKTLNPANGTIFTINIPVGAKMIVFAYPSSLRDVSSVVYVEGLGAEVKNIFTLSTISVSGANSYSPTNYKVYTYIPASPFSATATYNVTI